MGQGFSNNRIAFAGNGMTKVFVNGVQQSTASGTEISFSIPTGVKQVILSLDAVSMSGTNTILTQLGDSSGFYSTGYDFAGTRLEESGNVINSAPNTSGFQLRGNVASYETSGHVILTLQDAATNKWTASVNCSMGDVGHTLGGGSIALTSELTNVRIIPSGANTFDNGSVNIQYDNPDPTVIADSGGIVVQTVNSQDGEYASGTNAVADYTDDTILQLSETNIFLTASITPRSAANKLKIEVVANVSNSAANTSLIGALFQDSNTDASGVVNIGRNAAASSRGQATLIYWVDAGTTDSTTFKFGANGTSATTTYFNGTTSRGFGGRYASSITITEYKT